MIMNSRDLLNDYQDVKECDFKGEHYSVRDNGAVYRHARPGKKPRKNDEKWTFGTPNANNGYMLFGGIVRIHQIVATAFYGERDTKVYVVDHKDTNKRNNRVENLRWLTRLDNILANPASRKKVAYYCGSIEAFIENPSMLRELVNKHKSHSWMRPVSRKEGERTLENMNNWAEQPNVKPQGGEMGEWIYKPLNGNHQSGKTHQPSKQSHSIKTTHIANPATEVENAITAAKSPMTAVQKDWKTLTDFPLCPTVISETPLQDYYNRLYIGALMTQNTYGGTTIVDFAISDDESHIWVLGRKTEKNPIKPWTLLGIFFKNGKFVHENLHSFFKEIGGKKYFTLAQGKEWQGGDCFDDYC